MIADIHRRLRGSAYWQDILWQAAGNSFAQAIGILATPILTRLYTPHDFAVLNLFTQVVGFVAVIMTWRYEYFIQLPKENVDSKTLLRLVLWLGFGATVITTPFIFIFKDIFARWLGEAALANWLILAPVTAMLASFALALQHRVQRWQDYRKSGLAELINKGGYISSGLLGFWLLPGAAGLIMASAVGTLGKIVWLAELGKQGTRLKKTLTNRIPEDSNDEKNHSYIDIKRMAQTYARMSGSLVFSHVMLAITSGIPAIFIAKMYDGKTLGQFALVMSTLYLPSGLIGNAIGQVYYQRSAERWAKGESFLELWYLTAKRLILIGGPLYTSVAFASPWAYPFIFGQSWVDAGRYAVPLTVSAFLSFATSPLDRACLIVNAWWYIPLWHTARAASTGLVAWLAWINGWSFQRFLLVLVIQMSVIYLIDYWAEWRFASCKVRRMA